jgi:adenylate cyclase
MRYQLHTAVAAEADPDMSGYLPNGKTDPRTNRRLAAVAFVDVVGYTILMASQETRTHLEWLAVLDDIIRPQLSQHGGTLVKSTGDGILAEFPSALDGVEWARDVQRAVASPPAQDGRESSIVIRISVHLGDIMTTDFDVFGDGVNVAARLLEHAPPGGIVLSEAIYDIVRGSVTTLARDLGFLELKNFAKPVRAYALDPEITGRSIPTPPRLTGLPSIVVLPLQNLGTDPGDDYFSDGIVEDITLSLAGLHELMVISRGSALAYRGRSPDPREVGRALKVRYVMMGSLRRSERLVRVSVELCDANSGASLWGEKTEVTPGELFEVQDRIVERIVAGIAPNVRAAEMRAVMRKKPESFTAYDFTLRGLHIMNSLDPETFLKAREFLAKAMAEDPNFAMPIAWAARWHSIYVGQGWAPDRTKHAKEAVKLAARAIELDGRNALALATYGHLKSFLFHEYDVARVYLDRALLACPSFSLAWIMSSATLSYVGRGEEAVRHAEQALRLSPFDQNLYYYYMFFSLAHYANENYEEAVKCAKMSLSENWAYTATHRFLAAALAALGRLDEAREVAGNLMRLEPSFGLQTYEQSRQPFGRPEIGARLMEHLRKAGLPD